MKMGSEGAEIKGSRKLRLLCLHGFRTSGEIIKKQVTGKWPESVLEKLDLVFVDAPFPCHGKSDVEGIFDPPYYEWFQFNKVCFFFSFFFASLFKKIIIFSFEEENLQYCSSMLNLVAMGFSYDVCYCF